MAPLVKLAIVSKSGEDTPFRLIFLHLLYTLVEKQPYLVSTTSYQLSVNAFYCSRASDSNDVYRKHVRQNYR